MDSQTLSRTAQPPDKQKELAKLTTRAQVRAIVPLPSTRSKHLRWQQHYLEHAPPDVCHSWYFHASGMYNLDLEMLSTTELCLGSC